MGWQPPRPKRSPGDTFIDFIKRNFVPRVIQEYLDQARIRSEELGAQIRFLFERPSVWSLIVGFIVWIIEWIFYVLIPVIPSTLHTHLWMLVFRGPERIVSMIALGIQEALRVNIFDPIAESMITVLFDTSINQLRETLPVKRSAPEHLGLRFAKTLGIVSLRMQLLTLALSMILPEASRHIVQAVMSSYWALGLGFLGWQSLSPVATHAIMRPQERFLNYTYPKEIPSVSVIADLYASRLLSEGEALDLLREHGIDPAFHQKLLERAYSRISVSDLLDLYRAGKIDVSTLASYLAIHGYKDEDIPLIITANTLPKEENPPAVALSILRQALREGIIDENEFRSRALKIPRDPYEVELIIAIERAKKELNERLLGVSQIREAFQRGVLKEPEALFYLKELGLSESRAAILIETWKRAMTPRFVHLNAARLAEAYRYGVIDERTFYSKLLLLGWDEESANIYVKTVKAQIAEREDRETTLRVRKPTTSQVLTFMIQGIISQDEAMKLLKEIGYDETTAARLIKSALIEPPKLPRKLTKSEIVELWKKGFISTGEALDRLTLLDYTKEEAEGILFMEGPAIGESDLFKSWRAGLIPTDRFIEAMVRIGYKRADVVRIVRWLENPIELTEIVQAFKEGLITADEAKRSLFNLGYSPEQIQKVIGGGA